MRFAIGDRVRPTRAYLTRGRSDQGYIGDVGTVVSPPGYDWKPGTYYVDTETTLDEVHVEWDNGPRHVHNESDLEPLDLVSRLAELA